MHAALARPHRLLLPFVIAACGRDVAAPPEPVEPEVPPPPPVVFTITGTDALLVPGAEFHVRGSGLSEATVTVADAPAAPLHVSDTLLVVRVPAAPFEPCLADGSLGVRVLRGGAPRYYRSVAAQARPLRLSLAANAWTLASAAMHRGCAIVLEEPGEYLLVPFRADGSARELQAGFAFAYGAPTSSVVMQRTASPAAVRGDAHLGDAHLGGAPDVLLPASSPAAAARADDLAACAVPTTVGDSARFTLVHDGYWRTDTIAHWWLAARSGRLAVFLDAYTRDVLDRHASTAERLQRFLDHFDAAAARTLDHYLPPIPDEDGTGRITVFLTARPGANGAALPRRGLREGCEERGESTVLPLRNAERDGFPTDPWLEFAIVHEAAHIAHLGGSSPMPLPPGWVMEGLALLTEVLDALRHHPAPLQANLRSTLDLLRTSAPCRHYSRRERLAEEIYAVGCFRLAYALQQAMRETGLGLPEVIRRLTRVDAAISFGAIRNQLADTVRSEEELTAEWYLARYADDRLPGRHPALDIGLWNSVALLEEYRTVWQIPVLPPHDHVLRPGEPYEIQMWNSEAHYIRLTVAAGDPRTLTAGSGGALPSPSSGLAILRLP